MSACSETARLEVGALRDSGRRQGNQLSNRSLCPIECGWRNDPLSRRRRNHQRVETRPRNARHHQENQRIGPILHNESVDIKIEKALLEKIVHTKASNTQHELQQLPVGVENQPTNVSRETYRYYDKSAAVPRVPIPSPSWIGWRSIY